MKNLFIDTNIWLSLYHFTNDDLNQFNKLKDMLDAEIRLFVPRQVKDEITRNREAKLKDALINFEVKPIKYPAFCKEYDEYEDFFRDYSDLVKRYKTWEKKIKTDIFEETLPADTVIKELIEKAGIIECDDYVTLAYNRYRIGNPPGKDNKYGDAINWECLLSCVPDGEDLYFISADKDYKSIMSDDNFNPFLKEEWLTKKGSEIVFYKNLITFLNEHIKDIKLKTEEEKAELIDKLANSRSFVTTHGTIAMLKKYSGWTEDQIDRLCQIAEDNSQVSWILTDEDVMRFYDDLLENVDYDKLGDCSTKRIIDNIQISHMEKMYEAAEEYKAEEMEAMEEYYRH